MNQTPGVLRSLAREEKTIARNGRLRWFHWFVVALSLLLTIVAWQITRRQSDERVQAKFEREVQQVTELVAERMQKYEDGLWGGVAALAASGGHMTHEQWRAFAESLRLDVKYPGINGIGVILPVPRHAKTAFVASQRTARPAFRIYPDHDNPDLLPITYIEPLAANAEAVGLDVAHERNRHDAALRARDTGRARITGPIVLVQDANRTPGFLFYAPYYRDGAHHSVAERRAHFTGIVYAPFVVSRLMRGTLDQNRRQVDIRIADGDQVLYDEHGGDRLPAHAADAFRTTVAIPLYGRIWTFDIRANPSFAAATASSQPLYILIGGLTIDTMLLTLFVLLSRANRRTMTFAAQVTEELRVKAQDLEHSNAELKKFAYVASHDLKAPLRGIGGLVGFIEDDLEQLDALDADPALRRNFVRVHGQLQRMENLVQGLLNYASVGASRAPVSTTDVAAMVRHIGQDMGIEAGHLIAGPSLPVFDTDSLHLGQVFSNLIGNAVRYHHDPATMRIRIDAETVGDYYRFTVADNGPGIDPAFWDRIFDVFQSLQANNDGTATGIGLAIVRKSVEIYGGTVSVESVVGEGSTFVFTWPAAIELPQANAA